ncbi:endonuclease NucS [Deinococcus pimensis]|uniref:endonuclease NucS n=1 Tax=Deinococcus pimensis TaxID=309888 RepID=UPI000483F36A|nr:endonuclease NucS [Deinococcus pimensis]
MLRDHLHAPDHDALERFLRTHLASRECLVQIAGECEILYAGRATSVADAGNYLVLVKCDGSLQVHGPRGVKPVNWQPRTDELHVAVEDGRVVLTALRHNPSEMVRVMFLEAAVASALDLKEEAGFVLTGTEAQMQEALARHPDLIEDGLTLLDRELLVGVGGVDLYARDAAGRFVVVELKRGKATHDAVHQLARYVEAVRTQVPGEVRGILAAPAVTLPARTQLERLGLEFREVQALPAPPAVEAQPGLF